MTALAATETPSRASTVQEVVSKGGVEGWLIEDYAIPLIALEFAFKGGATQDPAGKPGAATLLSGLLDEGAGAYRLGRLSSRPRRGSDRNVVFRRPRHSDWTHAELVAEFGPRLRAPATRRDRSASRR